MLFFFKTLWSKEEDERETEQEHFSQGGWVMGKSFPSFFFVLSSRPTTSYPIGNSP